MIDFLDSGLEDNLTDDIILYHYSNKKLKEICPPFKIPNYESVIGRRGGEDKCSISIFTSLVTRNAIDKLVANGFKNWVNNGIYVHEIKLSDIADKLINFKYESVKEPLIEIYDNWVKEKNKLMHSIPDITKTEFSYWRRLFKAKYYHKYGLIYSSGDINDFIKMINDANNRFEDGIEYNIENGNKDQYASYMPHFNLIVSDCVKVSKVYKI